MTLNLMNMSQATLFMIGLLIISFVEAYAVARGAQNVGDYVQLLALMTQLQGPLSFFGTFYRAIQASLINSERMLELFNETPTVTDKPNVTEIETCRGNVEFENVVFGYDPRKPALDHVSFKIPAGTSTALVGESGGGKSTVFRLLFRHYNINSGKILVDGNDVTDISIDSLREKIGVVPQDTNMFNESIMYNLKYANQEATEEQIFAACKAAAIHDRIMKFPDKYETKVGERGVKLSGGERQRVAIARTILKNPQIILLDEATAALDTETEEKIQEAFETLSAGRTTIMIAHRLSTITKADQILVLSNGGIVESGTHQELIDKEGKYASMWRKQIRAQEAAVEAEKLRERAKQALLAAEVESRAVSEDEEGEVHSSAKGKAKKVNFAE